MKKNLLTICLSLISLLVLAQNNDKGLITSKIQEFKKHLYLSTSKDQMALMKAKSIKLRELEANELVVKTTPKSRLKSDEVEGAYIDTTHTYPWKAETQEWDTIPTTRIIKHYDEQHNLVQYQDFLWNAETESWLENIQFFYIYNAEKQPIDAIQQSWQFDGYESFSWVNVDHCIYEYNELGQQAKYMYQYWNYETNDWEASWMQEFSYDSNGNNTLIVESYWDAGIYEWTPGLNITNKFDSQNNVTENPIQYWDFETNNWTNAYKYVYEYNSFNKNINMIIQVWNTNLGDWDNYMQKISLYNDISKIDSYTVQMWDPFLSEWFASQRAIYKYDVSGNNICILGEDYDASNSSWSTSWVNYFDYNEQNKQISNSSLYYDSGMGNWIFGSKTKDAKIATSQKQKNVETTGVETLKVFPNPTSDWVNIENSIEINQIEVFNSVGNQMINRNNVDVSKFRLDIAELKTGVYFLIIKDTFGKSDTKRFIKN